MNTISSRCLASEPPNMHHYKSYFSTRGSMKITKLLAVLLIPLLFTGCFDIFHSISIDEGEVDIAFRYTVQSALIHMLNEFSEENINVTELLSDADSSIQVYDDLFFEVKPIDTSFHKGAEIHISGNMDKVSINNEDRFLLPVKIGDHYFIRIPSMADGDDMEEMAAVFLSGSKYTILIDLHGDLKDITEARLVLNDKTMHPNDKDSEILVNMYGSSMLIEIPILFLFYAPDGFDIELY